MSLGPDSPRSRSCTTIVVCLVLAIHAGLLAWQAYCYSPTVDEPAHLAAGLSHWYFGRFDLYRVNPPLVRMIAAVPLLFIGPQLDWSSYIEASYARAEFSVGAAFLVDNGFESFWLFTLARWACIPFSLIGGLCCYLWARDLYGTGSGFAALALWSFCPNILGNGSLITPDVGAAALGTAAGYTFWRWLRVPTSANAFLAGATLGAAELTKSTWIVLFALWPTLWGLWRLTKARVPSPAFGAHSREAPFGGLVAIILMGIYLLNLGYGFEDSFQDLGDFHFISTMFGGGGAHQTPGNRFSASWFGAIPVPAPANYLAGIDSQLFDFEQKKWSYLLGEQKLGGWWYYYLYAMGVKMPAGALALIALVPLYRVLPLPQAWQGRMAPVTSNCVVFPDELIVLSPGLVVIALVSSQTGFGRYLRYVIPAFPFLYVWASQIVSISVRALTPKPIGGQAAPVRQRFAAMVAAACLVAASASSLTVFPHSLSYFNEFAGGPIKGPAHLLDANFDWGQDLLGVKHWYDAHPEARPFHLAWFGVAPPSLARIDFLPIPPILPPTSPDTANSQFSLALLQPGWYALSANELYGYQHSGKRNDWHTLLNQRQPSARIGYSVAVFHIPEFRRSKASSH